MERLVETLEKENIHLREEIIKLKELLHKKNEDTNNLYARIEELEFNQKSYDILLGYTEDMSFDEKCNINEKIKLEEETILSNLSEQEKEEYDNNINKEHRMIFLGIEISRLQFEINELFQNIKEDLNEDAYIIYKNEKKAFLNSISTFYNLYKYDKDDLFDILLNIIRKQKKIYQYDYELNSI
jgi:hypothetical protein